MQLHKYRAPQLLERAIEPNFAVISSGVPGATVGMSIAFIIGSQRRLRFTGLFQPAWLKLRDKPKPRHRGSSMKEAWRSRCDARWLAFPVSDRTRSDNGMVNDATLKSIRRSIYENGSASRTVSFGMRTRTQQGAPPALLEFLVAELALLIAEQGES